MTVDQPPPLEWPASTIKPEPGCPPTLCGWMGETVLPFFSLPAIPLWTPDLSLRPPASRNFGLGIPPPGTSWRNRPWYVGGLFGPMFGDHLIDGVIDQDTGLAAGARFGYDLNYYFAVESNVMFVTAGIDDGQTISAGDLESFYFDGRVLLYPWGDSQWRPFYAIGGGAAAFGFEDAEGTQYEELLFQLPLSVGVKYLYERWFAFRAELTHHVVFGGSGLATMDNFAATAGFEIRYGARPRSYFPW